MTQWQDAANTAGQSTQRSQAASASSKDGSNKVNRRSSAASNSSQVDSVKSTQQPAASRDLPQNQLGQLSERSSANSRLRSESLASIHSDDGRKSLFGEGDLFTPPSRKSSSIMSSIFGGASRKPSAASSEGLSLLGGDGAKEAKTTVKNPSRMPGTNPSATAVSRLSSSSAQKQKDLEGIADLMISYRKGQVSSHYSGKSGEVERLKNVLFEMLGGKELTGSVESSVGYFVKVQNFVNQKAAKEQLYSRDDYVEFIKEKLETDRKEYSQIFSARQDLPQGSRH